MDDLEKDLKQSLGLIGQLDGEYVTLLAQLDEKLKNIKYTPGDTVAGIIERLHFLRANSLNEAAYVQNVVELYYSQVSREISKLKDPEFLDASAAAAAVLVRGNQQVSGQEQSAASLKAIDEPTYCLCNDVSYGEMVACDNESCPKEWFHLGCVGLSSAPKGAWLCPLCRPQSKKPRTTTARRQRNRAS